MDFYYITVHIFLEMLVEWVGEFYIISTLMFFKLEKRNHFFLRFFIGLLLILGICYPLAILYNFIGGTVFGRSVVYLILFILSIGHHIFSYKIGFLRNLLFLDMAYLTQNGIYKLFLLFISLLSYFNVFGNYGPTLAIYKTIYYFFFFIFVGIAYALYIRKIGKNILEIMIPNLTILISFFTILITIILTSVLDIYFATMDVEITPLYSESLIYIKVASDLLVCLLDLSIIIMFFAYMRRIMLLENLSQMKFAMSQSEEQYQITQETIESINIKCHDMRHKVHQIVGDNLSKETLEEVNEVINVYDSLIDTGNKMLDVILREKSLLCDTNRITFVRLIEGSAVDFLPGGDMFCLFGNILDNAIDATKSLKEETKRYINLSVKKIGDGIAEIECQNYYRSNLEFENDLPLTTNKDKTNHGFGMKSIKNLVNKYAGSMSISTKNNIFSIHIVIFNNQPNT